MRAAADPLASPTLAQLYMGQGRIESARRMLGDILAHDPTCGAALALRDRIDTRERGALELRFEGDSLIAGGVLRGPPLAAPAHVVLATYALGSGARVSPRFTSLPAPAGGAAGSFQLRFAAPSGPASACACLAYLHAGRVVVLAVAPTCTW